MSMTNPYWQNPFTSNPLLTMMMNLGNQETNPYEGNGLIHPVFVTPLMMHTLERSVPAWKDPALDNAKEGNMDCTNGATVSCTDSGKKTRSVDPQTGAITLKDLQIPEKISCFAGCAKFNPCNNNLYSSFVKSEHSCDSSDYFYYTCESFEEMDVFVPDCAKHDEGAKIDAPITTVSGHSKYKIWDKKVMQNRDEGKGREIMYDDDSVEPGMGVSVGEGNAGNAPITDEELGNVVDNYKYHEDKQVFARMEPYNNDIDNQNINIMDYSINNNKSIGNHNDTLELIIVCVWGVLFSVLFICFCCMIAGCFGYIVRKIRLNIIKNDMNKRSDEYRNEIRYIDMSDESDTNQEENENDTLCDDSIA